MDSNELLVKATRKLERRDIEDILEDLYTSKDFSLSKLGSIITKGTTKITKVDKKEADAVINTAVPYSIIKYDINHAMEYAGINNEGEFKSRIVKNNTSVENDIKKFKNDIYHGINGKPGVFYEGKGGKKYAILSSSELYPNNLKFKDEGVYNHQFIINATGQDYMHIVMQLFDSFLIDGIPFNIIVRWPSDMKDGYPDPIRLYCTDKNLQATIDEIERMTYLFRNKLEAPDWRICASINGLYGYTQIDIKNGNKTPMESIFDVMTKVIDQTVREYDNLSGKAPLAEYDWKARTVRLLKMKAMDNDRYEQMLDQIMKCIGELNIDLNDIFKIPSPKGLDKDIRDMDRLLGSIDNLANNLTVNEEMPLKEMDTMPEHEVEAPEELPPVGPIEEEHAPTLLSYMTLASALSEARRVGTPNAANVSAVGTSTTVKDDGHAKAEQPKVSYEVLSNALKQAREYNNQEDPLFVQVWEQQSKEQNKPQVSFDDLDGLLSEVRINAQASNIVDDHDWSNITNAPADEPVSKSRLEETQAYTPITDEMVLGYEESKKNSTPVLPDDVKEVDPSLVEEDEIVSLDTGSYDAIPIEVTGFDNKEVKSIVDAPQAGQTNNMVDTAVALNEYEGMITTNEAIQDVVNSKGEKVSLIDYLVFEGVSKKIPFDSVVVLNDGSELSGAEFIKNYVIPTVKNNRPDSITTVDQIINNYSTALRINEPEKKGIFAKLFGKKK